MAEVAPYSFENLTQSGIVKMTSKDDRNVTLTVDTFGGNTSLCVWTGAGGKPWKFNLNRRFVHRMLGILKHLRQEPRPRREAIFINKWEEGENKKGSYKQYGCIGLGIDDNLVFYVDVAAADLTGRHMFPMKPDGRFDFSNTVMTEKDNLVADIDFFMDALQTTTNFAERISSFKRQNNGGGGNRSGGSFGGGNKTGGNYGGGGNNYNRQQSSFGGGPDADSELHV